MSADWNSKKLTAGLVFTAIGLLAVQQSTQMELGTITDLGPGGFPFGLGILLVLLGLANVMAARLAGAGAKIEGLRSFLPLLIPISVVLFGLTIERFGLIPAVFLTGLVAGFAIRGARITEVALIGVALTVFGVVVFVYGLNLPFTLFKH